MLKNQGFRVALDVSNEKITYKIRSHSMRKLPFLLVIGDSEKASASVAVRARGNVDLGVMTTAEFMHKLQDEIDHKR